MTQLIHEQCAQCRDLKFNQKQIPAFTQGLLVLYEIRLSDAKLFFLCVTKVFLAVLAFILLLGDCV